MVEYREYKNRIMGETWSIIYQGLTAGCVRPMTVRTGHFPCVKGSTVLKVQVSNTIDIIHGILCIIS